MSSMKCLNLSDPIIAQAVSKYGETVVKKALDKYEASNFENLDEVVTEYLNSVERANDITSYHNNSELLLNAESQGKEINPGKGLDADIKEFATVPLENIGPALNSIQKAVKEIKSILPKEIEVEIIDDYKTVLAQGRLSVGVFKDGIVKLSSLASSSVAYHEAFHAVFRTMLSSKEQQTLLKEVRKRFLKPTKREIGFLMEQHKVSEKEATNLAYEEMLADEFAAYFNHHKTYDFTKEHGKPISNFFKRLLTWINKIFNNKITVEKLFNDITIGKYASKVPNITRTIAYNSSHPEYTAKEVQEFTKSLAYAIFKDVTELRDLHNLESHDIYDRAIDAILETRDYVLQAYEGEAQASLIYKLENLLDYTDFGITLDKFWRNQIDSYIKDVLKLKRTKTDERQEDDDSQDEQENTGQIKEHYKSSDKENASKAVKFMLAMVPQVKYIDGQLVNKRSPITGMYTFHDSTRINVQLKTLLSNVVPLKNEKGDHLDTFDIMLDKILEQSKYSPELLHLYNTLKNSSHITQTQFVVAMSLQRGNYINHEISGGKYNVKSNIITSEADSKSWAIFEQWAANFDKNFGKYENKKWVYDPAKIDSIVGNGGLFDLFDKALDAAYLSLKKDNFEEMLPENNADYRAVRNIVLSTFRILGITLEPNTWNKLLDEYGKDFKEVQWDSSLEGLPKLRQELSYRLVALDNIFLDLKRALETLKDYKGEPLNKETNLMYDQKSFFRKVLADSEASFKPVQGEAMVRGPEGKIWVYQNHSYKSLILQAIKNNDVSHLVNMSKSVYNKHSEHLKKLLVVNTAEDGTKTYSINKEYADKLEIQFYGNNVFKGDGENTGTKAKDLKNPDKLHDVFTKYMNGIFIGLAEADKTQQNYFKIPEIIKSGYSYNGNHVLPVSSNAMKILSRYFYAELERIKAAYDFCYKDGAMRQKEVNEETKEKELPENFIPNYHFFEDKNGVLHPGSAFHSFLFPNANLKELGLIQEGQLVLPTSPSELLSNLKIQDYIRKAFIDATRRSTKALINNGLVEVKDNKLVNVALDKGLIPSGVSSEYALNTLIGDFTLNGIVANVEDTMLFNGDPAFYKVKPKFDEVKDSETGEVSYKLKKWSSQAIYSDFMKRIPAPTAAGLLPRLYNENGIAKVNPYFDSVCITNIDKKPSDFFGKNEAFEKVAKLTNTSLSKVKESLSAYLDINQTDAQAWITLDLYRERMLSYGKWTEGPNSHEYVYNIIKENEERVKQGKEEIPLSLEQLSLLAQPLKTVHYELSVHPNLNTLIPIYNKQSEAPLLPFMTRGTSLDNLRFAMEELGVGHVAVLDARKVGAFDVVTIVDENKNLLSKDEIVKRLDKSYYSLQSQHVMLQTDLNAHLVGPTKVGSQTTKNVLGAVEIDATYVEGTVKGREMALVLEDKISKLSDIGYIKFKKDIGYSSEEGGFTKTPEGTSSLVKELIRASKGKINQNHLDALNAGVDIDSLPIATSIESTFANMNTKASVKLKQAGGAFIQLSNFGLVGKEVSLSDKIKNSIVWLKNPAEELLPMHTEDGKTVKAAQVLLPHNVLLGILNKQLGFNYKEMTHTQFQELISKGIIDKRVLEGFSYRIPNQAAGSNDAFEIVGFLPVEAGDTIVMYSDVTVKTGSDFDIDKAYVILPEFYYDKEKKRIGYYTDESHKNLDKREKAIANSRLRLMREILMHPKAFLNVMAPLDNPALADLCKRLFPEESMNNDLQFFSALQQLENKKTFDDAKTLVGLIADHMVSHNLYKAHNIRFNNYYLGIGNKDNKGNTALDKKETSQSKSNISMLLGLYMNAIVDAAKDPFISRANINLKTANIAFMLIRAGVELEWVTAFMGQPIIKEYLALQDIGESRFGSSDKLLEKLVTKYGYKDDVNKLYSSQWKGLPKDKNGDIMVKISVKPAVISRQDSTTILLTTAIPALLISTSTSFNAQSSIPSINTKYQMSLTLCNKHLKMC